MIPRKVLVYATAARGLLVFDEPDFPEVPLQVPGGTVEANEDIVLAARREFREETGLKDAGELRHLGSSHYSFVRSGVVHTHERSYFHLALPTEPPSTWRHYEMSPTGSASPILFRFFWIGLGIAREKLGLGMGEYLERLPADLWR